MSGELVTVATYAHAVEAALARNYLEAAGVRAFLLDAETVAMDWGLSNAIGGIKLQVHAEELLEAEELLNQLPGKEEEEPLPATAIATGQTIAELADDAETDSAKDVAADRAFRATVIGLLFPPLQLFALLLLFIFLGTPGKLSAGRRWKIFASVVLNVPLMLAVLVPMGLLMSWLGLWGSGVRWQRVDFVDVGFTIRFPGKPAFDNSEFMTEFGPAKMDTFHGADEPVQYAIHVAHYPAQAREAKPRDILAREVPGIVANWRGQVLQQRDVELNGTPGVEYVVDTPDVRPNPNGFQPHLIIRARFFYARGRLFIVQTARPNRLDAPPALDRFFDSFALH